ncbi:bestrophin family protein [Segnochrobactrum spirostomi]|uniref:Bestrophin n=1 Tax=Segnochrobactrum spirostomi TaxID=2608987 RepID=A0A6A7XZ44_9HYPH|nr:bestrophin family protein [Segnochrobactrum spirostomi]MQT11566.1 bestrophin [Segnochrobactrum spirostomi]
MIVREKPGILSIFFVVSASGGSILPRIFPQLFLVIALSALIVLAHRDFPTLVPVVSSAPFALIGIALSIFLGFRNNACYDRWWEARKLWGALLIAGRTLGRQTLILEGRGDGRGAALRARIVGFAIAFVYALRLHLRPGDGEGRVLERLDEADRRLYRASRNPPDFVLRRIVAELAAARGEGLLSDIEFTMIEATIEAMASVQGSCERIRSTPLPFAYTLLLHRTAYVFCFMLPFGFADQLGWLAPLAAGMVAYTFFGLDILGDELEEPFGDLPNDLPIAAIADTIAINLREALGETDLPPLPQPVKGVLM